MIFLRLTHIFGCHISNLCDFFSSSVLIVFSLTTYARDLSGGYLHIFLLLLVFNDELTDAGALYSIFNFLALLIIMKTIQSFRKVLFRFECKKC